MEKVDIATLRNEPQRNFSDRSNRSICDSTQTHTDTHNSIKVDQQINQLNNYTLAFCQNANNDFEIHRRS